MQARLDELREAAAAAAAEKEEEEEGAEGAEEPEVVLPHGEALVDVDAVVAEAVEKVRGQGEY